MGQLAGKSQRPMRYPDTMPQPSGRAGVQASETVAQLQRRVLPLDGEQKHAKHDEDGADNNASRQLLNPLQE
jgi:hypothetical protein